MTAVPMTPNAEVPFDRSWFAYRGDGSTPPGTTYDSRGEPYPPPMLKERKSKAVRRPRKARRELHLQIRRCVRKENV